MRHHPEKIDRDFAADRIDSPAADDLRLLFEQGEIADTLDAAVRQRFGELIAEAVLGPRRGN